MHSDTPHTMQSNVQGVIHWRGCIMEGVGREGRAGGLDNEGGRLLTTVWVAQRGGASIQKTVGDSNGNKQKDYGDDN